MAVPGLPTGALGAAASAVTAPFVDAADSMVRAFGAITDAIKAVFPVLETLGQKFKEFGEGFKNTFRTYIGEPLVAALKSIGNVIKFIFPSDVIDGAKTAYGKVGVAIGATGQALLGMAGAAAVAAGAVAVFGSVAARLVAKANPAVAEQFNFALNDMLAVLGQALMPILQVATQFIRLFADALLTFSGTLGNALGDIFGALMPIFEVFVEIFARLGQLVAEVLRFVAPLIRFVAEGIRTIFEWIGQAVRFLLSLIGVEIGESKIKKGASVGAAVRHAEIGSVESVIQKAQVASFSLGTASSTDYAKTTADHTIKMTGFLGEILRTLQNPLRVIDVFREIAQTKADIKVLERDAAPGGFYDPEEFKKRAAARTPEENARLRAFFKAREKAPDGGGTVKADGGGVGP